VPAEREGLAPLPTVSAIVMNVALDRAPQRKATRVRVPAVEGSPLATLAIEPGGAGSSAPEGAALVALVTRPDWARAHLDADDSVVEKALLAALDGVFPRASEALRFLEIRRYPHALPHFDVGCYRRLGRLRGLQTEQRAAGRRLYFAGDQWLSPTLEGAVASGQRAAVELCADFGVPLPR
jgi:predicted NAD/FAD-dependent oxidoreductase